MKKLLKQTITGIWKDPSIQAALILYLIVRIGLGLWLPFVNSIYSRELEPAVQVGLYKGVAVESSPWLEAWQRWDTLHYQAIAERGYTAFDTALFTPPLYPMLMRWGAVLLGGNTLLSGILVSNLAYLGTLITLYRLALFETGDHGAARRTLIYLAVFPTGFFFLGAFSETLFLLAAILTIYAARRKQWVTSGLWGGAAALTRINGFFLPLPLGLAALSERRSQRTWRPFWMVALTLAGFAIFPLYVWVGMGQHPWTIVEALNLRGGYLTWPGANLLRSIELLLQGSLMTADVFDLLFTVLFFGLAVPVWRMLPKIYSGYYLTLLVFYLIRMGPGTQPLLGMTRYVLLLFPAFIILGIWGQRPWVNRLILYPSVILLIFMSSIFTLWGVI